MAGTHAPTPQIEAALEFAHARRLGPQVSRAVRRVLGELRWQRKLEDAAKRARAEHKLIVWVQALGELRGFT